MNTIGIALISFGIGLIISWKLAERDRKNAKKKPKNRRIEKTEEYFHREVFPMINDICQREQGTP